MDADRETLGRVQREVAAREFCAKTLDGARFRGMAAAVRAKNLTAQRAIRECFGCWVVDGDTKQALTTALEIAEYWEV